MSSSRKLKKEIFKILQEDSFEIIESKLSSFEPENLIHPLFSAICRHEESIRWNGIFSFGSMMKRLVSRNLEDGRVVMRRFLWSLNDESGGIGWGAPEAMAECMVNNVQLLE